LIIAPVVSHVQTIKYVAVMQHDSNAISNCKVLVAFAQFQPQTALTTLSEKCRENLLSLKLLDNLLFVSDDLVIGLNVRDISFSSRT